jgi:P27 family predicted phage terminase small subunit
LSSKDRLLKAHKAAEPEMPVGLSLPAQHEWRRVTGLLRDREALDSLDQAAINDYVVCWDRLRECEADIAERGCLVESDRGRGKVKNPSIQVARQYRDALVQWSKEFALTPAARSRVVMPEPKPPAEYDPWADFPDM